MRLAEIIGADVVEIARENPDAIREGLRAFHPAEIADLVESLHREDRLRILEALSEEALGKVLTYLDGETLKVALTRLQTRPLANALDEMEVDDAARLLSILPEEKRVPLLDAMTAPDAAAARGLLRYEPRTAGRLMTDKFVRVRPEWTVGDAMQHLREIDPEVATVANLYAVNDADRLVGVVSLRRMLPASSSQTVGQLMNREVIAIPADTSQDEVARLVSKYSFSALPVVDDGGRILGIVTVDDVLDVLVARETESALRMGGVASDDEPWNRGLLDYFGTSVLRVVRSRINWLLLLFVAETFTGSVMRSFEGELKKVVALSFSVPLIIGTGGNAGSQTVSTIIRAMSLGQIRFQDGFRVLLRETTAGFLLGSLLCMFAVVRTLLWGTGPQVAMVVGLTIMCVCVWANVIGAIVPILAQRLKIDPTVVSAPFITTVVDGTGLAIYFLIAKAILKI